MPDLLDFTGVGYIWEDNFAEFLPPDGQEQLWDDYVRHSEQYRARLDAKVMSTIFEMAPDMLARFAGRPGKEGIFANYGRMTGTTRENEVFLAAGPPVFRDRIPPENKLRFLVFTLMDIPRTGSHSGSCKSPLLTALAWLTTVVLAQAGQPNTPWDMNQLAKAPEWTALERPKAEGVRAITYAGLPFRSKSTRVFAWLGVPAVKVGERVPAMVLVHGGGGTAFDEWVRLWVGRGYAAIAMDTCGQVPVGNYGQYIRDQQGGPPGWGGFDQMDTPQQDQWTYHAVADVILAHSLIRSLPEVDPQRTGVTGISWGGYLTCIVAGVDPRFKLAVPVYGCGFYRDTVFEGELGKLSPEKADQWMALWDPSVYLGNAEMPFLWVTGSNDFAYTMNALQRSYRLPKGPRSLCIRLRMPHAHGGAGENPEEIRVFADSVLKGGLPLPPITGFGRDGTNAWVTFSARIPVVKAEFNYTRDPGRWQERKWESVPAQRTGGKFSAGVPAGTSVYYFNLFDERNCAVSTEHQECP